MDLEQRIAKLSPAKLALLEKRLRTTDIAKQKAATPVIHHTKRCAPLSFSQERLWFLEQLEPNTSLYNLPLIVPLQGPVDQRRVENTVLALVTRHSALRTRFIVKGGTPYQLLFEDPREGVDFAVIDRGSSPRSQQDLHLLLNQQLWIPFDLEKGPLLRVRLVLQPGNTSLLIVVMHHIVSDGWSLGIFSREFRTLYEHADRHISTQDWSPPYQYVDYSIDQRERLQGPRLDALLTYWKTALEGAPSLTALPLDHPRPARQSFRGSLFSFELSQEVLQRLDEICSESHAVPFMVLLSAFKVLLFRYTQQTNVVIGTPIANRSRSEYESAIGFFTNTLVLSNELLPDMSFRQLVAQVRETTLSAYEHQELPFEKLVSELRPERSLSHNPLFQVMFTFQNLPTEPLKPVQNAPESQHSEDQAHLDFKFSKFDLTLAMTQHSHGASAVFEYSTDLFDAETIERMAGHFINIVRYVLQNPHDKLSSFSFLSDEERTLILDQWNDTRRNWPEVLPLYRRFEQCAQQAPDATALVFCDRQLSYHDLHQQSDMLCSVLQQHGVTPGSVVGICLHRSLEMVIGLLGILKTGAAYLPIEPNHPVERIQYMLRDANVSQVLTTTSCSEHLDACDVETIVLDGEHSKWREKAKAAARRPLDESAYCINDGAYIIYTSGSTGRPKGVLVSHFAIDNRLQWMQEAYALNSSDRVLQKTPYTFDVSVWEFFWTLSVGACLVLAEPERHKESLYLVDLIQKEKITCAHFVPSMLQLFLQEDLTRCATLRRIICSGEALSVEQCRRLKALPGVQAHNLYGPTEAAIDVTHWDCGDWNEQYTSVPIGRPISNTQIYILDERLQPTPIGVPGEIYIGGHNLATGYINRQELTAHSFVPNLFSDDPKARLYRTGDLGRFRSDGCIEFIGRIDSQVKLRGLRIELGEIETQLRGHPSVRDAAVVVYHRGHFDDRLAAYIVPHSDDSRIDTDELTSFLSKRLPSYMIPALVTVLPRLPLSPNGKLDRKYLPEPSWDISRQHGTVAPENDVERKLVDIWKGVLKVDNVGVIDDFFALGGHSILVTQVINAVNGLYNLNLPVRILFENSTIRSLAAALDSISDEAWLDESRTAKAMLSNSPRRWIATLERRSEAELDEYLIQHEDQLSRFRSVEALLAWSLGTTSPSKTPPQQNQRSFHQLYWSHCLDMVNHHALAQQVHRPLNENEQRLFDAYVTAFKERICDVPPTKLSPFEVTQVYAQLVAFASTLRFKPL